MNQQKKHWYYAHNAKVDPHKKCFLKKMRIHAGSVSAVHWITHTLCFSSTKKDERRWCGTSCHPRINHLGKWKFHTNKSECIYVSITLAAAVCIQSPSLIGLQITHDSVEQQSIWKRKQLPENNVKILENGLHPCYLIYIPPWRKCCGVNTCQYEEKGEKLISHFNSFSFSSSRLLQ